MSSTGGMPQHLGDQEPSLEHGGPHPQPQPPPPPCQIIRFYYRCNNCAAEFTMKTDPANADYVLEEGATRNYGGRWFRGQGSGGGRAPLQLKYGGLGLGVLLEAQDER